MVNIESIHDITSKDQCGSPNHFWSAKKSGDASSASIVPIRVCVDHSESRLTVTYFAQHRVSAFVSHAMCGLYRKFAALMFSVTATVSQRTGTNGQYVFVLNIESAVRENRTNSVGESQSDFDYFRYKDHLSNEPRNLFMSVHTFSRAFPFHFICDTDLRLVQIGSGIIEF